MVCGVFVKVVVYLNITLNSLGFIQTNVVTHGVVVMVV